jgi:hypothetical protein
MLFDGKQWLPKAEYDARVANTKLQQSLANYNRQKKKEDEERRKTKSPASGKKRKPPPKRPTPKK